MDCLSLLSWRQWCRWPVTAGLSDLIHQTGAKWKYVRGIEENLPAVFTGSAREKAVWLRKKKKFLFKALFNDSKEVGVFTFVLIRWKWSMKENGFWVLGAVYVIKIPSGAHVTMKRSEEVRMLGPPGPCSGWGSQQPHGQNSNLDFVSKCHWMFAGWLQEELFEGKFQFQ